MKKRIIEYYINTDQEMTAIDTQPNTPGWLIAYLFCKYDNMNKQINDTFLQSGAASIVGKNKLTLESIKQYEIEMVEL